MWEELVSVGGGEVEWISFWDEAWVSRKPYIWGEIGMNGKRFRGEKQYRWIQPGVMKLSWTTLQGLIVEMGTRVEELTE